MELEKPSQRHERVTELFLAACELPSEDRGAFLDQQCADDAEVRAEIAAMLAADEQAPRFLEPPTQNDAVSDDPSRESAKGGRPGINSENLNPALALGARTEAHSSTRFPRPERIGGYKILDVLGEGGMAVVYLAEQENPRRKVALKIIKPRIASRGISRRLEHEAHILGRLQHPGIAQIFEAGTTDVGFGPQPYFAMEYVAGQPLTNYADANGLGTRERLELLTKVCAAVQHAHQKGVIHRDLKPANILVGDKAQPKVLDFGIARATDVDIHTTTLRTDIGQLIGTIPYMSPEQAGGDPEAVDFRTDVYALGVIAFELLAGRLPHDLKKKMIHEAVRIIRDEEPTSLSSVNRVFRGDLDTVVAKALGKDRERRYQTVSEFAGDVARYLHDEPITARPASAVYQLRRFARRNKGLAWGAATTITALLVGIASTTIQAIRATQERDRAVQAERREAAKSRLWVELIAEADTWKVGNAQVVESILDRLAGRIHEMEDDPRAKATLCFAIGEGYQAFGRSFPALPQLRKAEPQLRKALEIRTHVLGPAHRETLEAVEALGVLLADLAGLEDTVNDEAKRLRDRRFQTSDQLLTEGCKTARANFGPEDPLTLKLENGRAGLLGSLGRNSEASAIHESVLAARLKILGEDHPDVLASRVGLANNLLLQGKVADTERELRIIVEKREASPGHQDSKLFDSLIDLTVVLDRKGKSEEAVPYLRRALEIQNSILGEEDPRTMMTMNNFGMLLRDSGHLEEAEAVLRRTLELRMRILGPTNGNCLRSQQNLATLLTNAGRLDEAYQLLVELQRNALAGLEPQHGDIGLFQRSLGHCLYKMGRLDEAELELRGAIEKLIPAKGESHPWTVKAIEQIAELYSSWDKPEVAAEWRAKLPPKQP